MRTTIDLPDELFREVKSRAALQGRKLKDLVADGLRLLLGGSGGSPTPPLHQTHFPIIQSKDPSRRLTPEMIAEAEEESLANEAQRIHARPARRQRARGARL